MTDFRAVIELSCESDFVGVNVSVIRNTGKVSESEMLLSLLCTSGSHYYVVFLIFL